MDYSMFKDVLLEALKERFGEDSNISYNRVLKNNGIVLDGICVKRSDSKISPTVYVNDYYQDFLGGRDLDDICTTVEKLITENEITEEIDVDELIDFDRIKDNIVFKLINYAQNEELLQTVPYRKYLDLAVVYYIIVSNDLFEGASILINNNHLKLWNITGEEIDEIAKENSPVVLKAELKSMADVFNELLLREGECDFDLTSECNMYVLSNSEKMFGAAAILYENIISDFSEKLGCDLYILPSSVHEVIIVPSDSVEFSDKLDEMICEVNETQLPRSEVLSDHFYYYSKADDCITF